MVVERDAPWLSVLRDLSGESCNPLLPVDHRPGELPEFPLAHPRVHGGDHHGLDMGRNLSQEFLKLSPGRGAVPGVLPHAEDPLGTLEGFERPNVDHVVPLGLVEHRLCEVPIGVHRGGGLARL